MAANNRAVHRVYIEFRPSCMSPENQHALTPKYMLNYNTKLARLILPEYGRNIQRMVDYCLTIEDKDERTQCAYSIVKSMGNLFPELRAPENEHKLWDHLAIMSDFKLDIDFPCDVIQAADLHTQPATVSYNPGAIKYRHYGRLTQQFIDKVASMEEGEERDEAIRLLANHMKKQMLAVNTDGVDDAKVFKDLMELSHGTVRLSQDELRLHEFKEIPQATGKKKKKKNVNTLL